MGDGQRNKFRGLERGQRRPDESRQLLALHLKATLLQGFPEPLPGRFTAGRTQVDERATLFIDPRATRGSSTDPGREWNALSGRQRRYTTTIEGEGEKGKNQGRCH